MEDTLAHAVHHACANLDRIADELGADGATILIHQGARHEVAYGCSKTGRRPTSEQSPASIVHRWGVHPHPVVFMLDFADGAPATRHLPDEVTGQLDSIALAFWSSHVIGKLRTELKAVNASLASRKLIERAKGLLQFEHGISEESAYRYLQDQSRRRRITLGKFAEEVVSVRSGNSRTQ